MIRYLSLQMKSRRRFVKILSFLQEGLQRTLTLISCVTLSLSLKKLKKERKKSQLGKGPAKLPLQKLSTSQLYLISKSIGFR
jgi:hypothetical protein